MFHSPVLISESADTRYAICENCDQNIESWFFDQEFDRVAHWSPFGVLEVAISGNSSWLKKFCEGSK